MMWELIGAFCSGFLASVVVGLIVARVILRRKLQAVKPQAGQSVGGIPLVKR